MSKNCDVIAIFSTYGQFGAIRKPDLSCIVCKTYVFIISNHLSFKNSSHTIALIKGTILAKKCYFFAKRCGYHQY